VSTARETEWERRTRRARERAEHVAAHGPGCQICGAIPKSGGLHQDHDHTSGRNRGWLCHSCNRNLWVRATPNWLMAAAIYLHNADPASVEMVEPWGYIRDELHRVGWPTAERLGRWGKP
jgi:Recombination endonuclease VII